MSSDPVARLEYESMVFARHLAGSTRRSGGELDQSAYVLLTLLQACGPSSIGDLAATTGLDASTLNRQTAALLRNGHAERITDPDGGVARKFRLTPDGERALNEERSASTAALDAITADWADDDRAALATLLGNLNMSIEARVGRSWPRPEL
ncbi:MarR family winged helix-turn-helix transcriptional regulator [Cellulomonas fengjieae]|nr:MarR family winged helix-turn-helix transcriptional regulator [Cellulomonas fengjieae]